MYNLEGKVALVSGTSSRKGIGCGIALRMAREGADVVVTDKYIEPNDIPVWDREAGWYGLDSLVKEIESFGRKALAVTADVSNNQQVNELVRKALNKFGKIDILVNNAAISFGVSGSVPIIEMSEEAWNKSISVNTTGVFLMCKAVAKNMIERRSGKIINISSISGNVDFTKKTAYVTSKFGVNGFTQALALELAPYHINVNAICPSGIASWGGRGGREMYEAMKQGLKEEEAAATVYNGDHSIPIGRPGNAEDVARMVAFLASSESDYITGQAINVNGGRMVAH